MIPGGRQRLSIQIHAALEVAALGQIPSTWDRIVIHVYFAKEVSMHGVQTLGELSTGLSKRVQQAGFKQARFVDGSLRAVIWSGGPLCHPVKDFELVTVGHPFGEVVRSQ